MIVTAILMHDQYTSLMTVSPSLLIMCRGSCYGILMDLISILSFHVSALNRSNKYFELKNSWGADGT